MTLIVAGYNQNKYVWDKDSDAAKIPDRRSGMFLLADSLISTETPSGRKALVSEFRKIVEVQIDIWEPHFIRETFNNYLKVYQSNKCFIAFAGSTLTAQHIINNISGHLSQLKIDFEEGINFKCVVRKPCDDNNLIRLGNSNQYGEDIFVPQKDYHNLLSAEFVSDVVEHSINKALDSKMQYVLDPTALAAMRTDIILAITCPIERRDYLYKYKFASKVTDNGVIAYCDKTFIEADELAIIGMESVYGSDINQVAKAALSTHNYKENITEFVAQCVREDETNEIGLPIAIKTIDGNRTTKEFIKE
ncbi:hypothetical protein [Pseudoalteromonas phenolica]|uniref:Uncharacterized protein n=1 Tax=Pseudoalteromonas phenolica TaxID=161398 RepID=A0A0S2JYL7_9GAMM|nr:hypothetical protein [Pseudoalteromonas phenolica]ALO40964.1 hypothetical protein PP2015_440 [Pseudoalteromonas phenolica]MBE0354515.1 hypothetical protein [Pseudoalteromonas phenolica O-BC30]RXE94630.1 hypothetical protein D9981_18690 [Pseudoalteromonas phenolica O-BC30]